MEITVVNAHHREIERKCPLELLRIVNLHQDVESSECGLIGQIGELVIIQTGDDQ